MESDSDNIVTEDEITVNQQMELEDIKTKIKQIKHSPHYNKSIEQLSTVYDVPPSATIQELKDPSLETFISKGGIIPDTIPDSTSNDDSPVETGESSSAGEKEGFQNGSSVSKNIRYLQKLVKAKYWSNAVNDMIKPMYNNDTKQNLKKDGRWVRTFFEHIAMIMVSVLMSYNVYYFVFMYDWNIEHFCYKPNYGVWFKGSEQFYDILNLLYKDARLPILYCSYIFTWLFPMFFDFLGITRYRRICYLFILLVSLCLVFVGSGTFMSYIGGLIMGSIGPYVPIIVLLSAIIRIVFGDVVTSSGNSPNGGQPTNKSNDGIESVDLTENMSEIANDPTKLIKIFNMLPTGFLEKLQKGINSFKHFGSFVVAPVSFIMQSILTLLWALIMGTILALLGILWFIFYVGSGLGSAISLGTLWPFTQIRAHIDEVSDIPINKVSDIPIDKVSDIPIDKVSDIPIDKVSANSKVINDTTNTRYSKGINKTFLCKKTTEDKFYESVNNSEMFQTWFETCWLRTIFWLFMILKGISVFHYIKNAHVAILFIVICFSIAALLSGLLVHSLRKYIFKRFYKEEDKPLNENTLNDPQLINKNDEQFYKRMVYPSDEQKPGEQKPGEQNPNVLNSNSLYGPIDPNLFPNVHRYFGSKKSNESSKYYN
jgi:hypothetical protein